MRLAAHDVPAPAAEARLQHDRGSSRATGATARRAACADDRRRRRRAPRGRELVVGAREARAVVEHDHSAPIERLERPPGRDDAVERGQHVEPAERDVSRPQPRHRLAGRQHDTEPGVGRGGTGCDDGEDAHLQAVSVRSCRRKGSALPARGPTETASSHDGWRGRYPTTVAYSSRALVRLADLYCNGRVAVLAPTRAFFSRRTPSLGRTCGCRRSSASIRPSIRGGDGDERRLGVLPPAPEARAAPGYTLVCGRYYRDGYTGYGLRSQRRLDWGDPAYLASLARGSQSVHGPRWRRAALVGVSYSGFGVATLASHHPELRPDRLIVIDSYLDLPARRAAAGRRGPP